jgi:hypothetical protein
MSSQTEPTTRHYFTLEIAIADELGIDADEIAERLFDALAPVDERPCPIFGKLRMKNGHEALLALSLTHTDSKAASITFAGCEDDAEQGA